MTENISPLITVIIAVFNGAKTLQQSIDSVVQQTYSNKELIIIDGGSTDGTVELLEANSPHINYWISEPDQGIYNAWNKALAQAKGDWICFLGADDFLWDDQVLTQLSEHLINVPSHIRLAYGKVMLLSYEGETLYAVGEPWEKIKTRFMSGLCLSHQGVMHRCSLFEQNGNFDESFRIGGDYELTLRELKTADAIFMPEIIIAAMRQGGLSSNPANSLEAMRDVRRAQKIHGQSLPSFFWLLTMTRIYMRQALWRLIGAQVTKQLLDLTRHIRGLPSYWTKI